MTRSALQTPNGPKAARKASVELARWRALDAYHALHILADYAKEDVSFKPTSSASTRRIHASAAGTDWEFLVDGPKFYDTRAKTGGGGAVDLVMHLWRVPFTKAVIMLQRFDFNSPIQLV